MFQRVYNAATSRLAAGRDRYLCRTRTRLLHGPAKVDLGDTQMMVTLLTRNAAWYMPTFLDHHFSIGAAHVLVIDNGSTDETVEICRRYDRVTVLSNTLPVARYESILRRQLSRRVARGGWVLFADSDELTDPPDQSATAMADLMRYGNAHGYTAFTGHVIDYFSLRPYAEISGLGYADAVEALDHYSLEQLDFIPYADPDRIPFKWFLRHNRCVHPEIGFRRGGIRRELFDENPFLTRHSLVRNSKDIDLMVHPHCASNVNVGDVTMLVRHYKFAGDWISRERATLQARIWRHHEGVARMNTVGNAAGYRFEPAAPRRWMGTDRLVEEGFLKCPRHYRDFVAASPGHSGTKVGAQSGDEVPVRRNAAAVQPRPGSGPSPRSVAS